MIQMAQSTKLLQEATPDETSAMPFFSQETQDQLAQTIKLRDASSANKKDVEITEAPLDYSGKSVTNPEVEKKELS